jgi:hypothetical protein
MMTLSMDGSWDTSNDKTPHCYHLVTLKTAAALQLFAANRTLAISRFAVDRRFYVLDLFSWHAMLRP